jgi:hypothetical protein
MLKIHTIDDLHVGRGTSSKAARKAATVVNCIVVVFKDALFKFNKEGEKRVGLKKKRVVSVEAKRGRSTT